MDKYSDPEVWMPIPGYDGWYEVSNLGRIRSYHKFGWGRRIYPEDIKLYTTKRGYVQVSLTKDKVSRQRDVHRLVAAAFLPKAPAGMQIDHINGDKTDNRAINLEWVTPRENTMRSLALGLKPTGEKHGMSKLTNADVVEMRRLYKTGKYSHRKLGALFGISHATAGKIIRNEAWRGTQLKECGTDG